ncbi:phosphatase PAP2 family protein [Sphingobacteriales bacterium CHB3]|nr:phosphatase PAP2 family protein [Sphingobacteriales bacterium CHB3]
MNRYIQRLFLSLSPIASRHMRFHSISKYLHSADMLFIGFNLILSCINIVFADRIPYWWVIVLSNFAGSTIICIIAYARHTIGWKPLRLLHDWYVPVATFFSYKALYFMIKPIHGGRDYDDVLMAIDRWLFGVNPTEWIMQFATPWLTEILQIAYTLFYLLFLILGYEFYRRHNLDLFHYFMFTCVYGFFLSYLGYFLLPAVGPRFTLHDFAALDAELPGLLFTESFRWFVNAGGSIPTGVPNEIAIKLTQRDVFPSGHTMMTIVLMYLSGKYGAKSRYFMYVVGTLLIIATVYHRYHYVIDLIAGAVFALFCITTSSRLYIFLKRKYRTMESRVPDSLIK